MGVRVELLSVGSTRHFGALVGLRTWKRPRFPALVALIRHPTAGLILFDTGFGSRLLRGGGGLGLAIYRRLRRVRMATSDLISHQLLRHNVDPRDLKLIIVSHVHADNIGGLGDLPPRPVMWSREARETLRAGSAFSRFRAGVFSSLVPDHVWAQDRILEDRPAVDLFRHLPGFPLGYDVLGDGTLIAVPLPGHARGQIGLLCRVEGGRQLFLLSDAAWVAPNVTAELNPKAILNTLTHDAATYHQTLGTLRDLHRERPDIVMIPSHCAGSIEAWQNG